MGKRTRDEFEACDVDLQSGGAAAEMIALSCPTVMGCILSYLGWSDLRAARLTCRAFHCLIDSPSFITHKVSERFLTNYDAAHF